MQLENTHQSFRNAGKSEQAGPEGTLLNANVRNTLHFWYLKGVARHLGLCRPLYCRRPSSSSEDANKRHSALISAVGFLNFVFKFYFVGAFRKEVCRISKLFNHMSPLRGFCDASTQEILFIVPQASHHLQYLYPSLSRLTMHSTHKARECCLSCLLICCQRLA